MQRPPHDFAPLQAALDYGHRGWAPIDLPYRSKNPNRLGWQHERLTEDEIRSRFNAQAKNIGLLLGEASGGLTDVDLDCPEARLLAPFFLPSTGMVSGRQSAPRSHWWYRCQPIPETRKFTDAIKRPEDEERAVLLELRSSGCHTLVPPSIHPDGDAYLWEADGEPAPVDGHVLKPQLSRLAAASLLARYWPARGNRHDASKALAGGLLRAGWDAHQVEAFILAVATGAADEEARDRPGDVRTTMRRIIAERPATGWPELSKLVGPEVVDRVREWLEILSAAIRDAVAAERILRFRTARDIALETPAEPEWAAKPWVAFGAITELDGKIKVAGKTTFATHMLSSVIEGRPFLGEPTTQSGVVYLTEQPPVSFRDALRRAGLLECEDFVVLAFHDTLGIDWPTVAEAAIREAKRRGARVLAIDTLGRFAGLQGDSENDSGAALTALEPLHRAAAQEGMAVVIVRQERKSGGEVGDAARGSSAFGGGVDIILSLRRREGNTRPTMRVIQALSRFDATPDTFVIDLQRTGYVPLGSEQAVAVELAKQALLDAAPSTEEEAKRLEDLADHFNIVKRTVAQAAVEALCSEGKLRRVGQGKRGDSYRYWRLPGAPEIHSAATPHLYTAERNDSAIVDGQARPGDVIAAEAQALFGGRVVYEDED